MVGWDDEERVVEYARSSVVDRVLLKDFAVLTGGRDALLLGKLFAALVSKPGTTANLDALSREFGASRITVGRYLRSLERSMLLRGLSNYRPSTRSSSRKLRRYYPATTSLVRAVSRQAFEGDPGGVQEAYVVNALGASRYYREGREELDVVLGDGETAVEVKATPDARDGARLARVAGRIGARRRVIVSLSEGASSVGVDTVPAYALEWEMSKREGTHDRGPEAEAR
ncbi:MAG: ATP-binding protein [Thaumarchaeota archaeon]|nr:ATP-binding protein [Nitrososphaerota archaeon]